LALKSTEGRVEITVQDTGHGITKEFLPYVFDRFRQADSSTTRQHGGLGLGLAIARHLVEIHGGTIKAESAGPGQGATFSIHLPLIEPGRIHLAPDGDAAKDSTASRESLNGLHVLIVDDDEDTLELMATALTSRQAIVTAVSSANEALNAFKTNRPDVVVTDIAMPEEDGYGLIAGLRALEQNGSDQTPAIAITAYAKEEDRLRALSSGFQLYLAKPIEITDLVSAVARAARRETEA
jgi:CheY-like chemotaxis protein